MKKKLVSIVFSCLLVGNLLSGCGKTGSSIVVQLSRQKSKVFIMN